jgi:hypothetical protein
MYAVFKPPESEKTPSVSMGIIFNGYLLGRIGFSTAGLLG